jgi:hypothetical protein
MKLINKTVTASAILALASLMSGTALGQGEGQSPGGAGSEAAAGAAPGQQPSGAGGGAAAAGVEPLVTFTTFLTVRSYTIPAGAAQGNLEGASCGAAPRKMISGACHPFYNDRMTIINQFPNIPLNTWRCGFKNNTGAAAQVWIYTVCAQ